MAKDISVSFESLCFFKLFNSMVFYYWQKESVCFYPDIIEACEKLPGPRYAKGNPGFELTTDYL